MRGLYKGVASPVLTVGLMNAVLFMSYNWTLSHVENQSSVKTAFIAGSISGVLASCLNAPTELVKCLSQTNLNNKGFISEEYMIFKDVFMNRNGIGITRGLFVTLVRDIPSCKSLLSLVLN